MVGMLVVWCYGGAVLISNSVSDGYGGGVRDGVAL